MPKASGAAHHSARLTPDKVRAIRAAYAARSPDNRVTYQTLADEHGTTLVAIFKVVKRVSWKHVS